MGSAASAALGVEVCAPLLLLCWLCCWPDDDHSETSSSGKPPKNPVIASTSRRSSTRSPLRRLASSAASLHLPGTSGSKKPLSAHRSHEDIPRRRLSHSPLQRLLHLSHSHLQPADDTRYHSAPSVIDEVIHRRDWERSTKELFIPLKPEAEMLEFKVLEDDNDSLEAPKAEPESSSIMSLNKSVDQVPVSCKKHNKNIKSSKNRTRKESVNEDFKDTDATELQSQFISAQSAYRSFKDNDIDNIDEMEFFPKFQFELAEEKTRSDKAKEAKQTFNESIKTKDNSKTPDIHAEIARITSGDMRPLAWCQVKYLEPDLEDTIDRSGAMHDSLESRCSLPFVTTPLPPTTDDAPPYDAGHPEPPCEQYWRLRTASEGAIPPQAQRPQSGAFSESDVEPPLQPALSSLLRLDTALSERGHHQEDNKETAI